MMDKIFRQQFFNGTPLVSAAYRGYEQLSRTDAGINDPYRDLSKDGSTPGELKSCRQSYHVVMTDGDWNTPQLCNGNCLAIKNFSKKSSVGLPSPENPDDLKITIPSTISFDGSESQANLYRTITDSTNTTLADLALRYWATDIRPSDDMPNDLSQYVTWGEDKDDYLYGSQVITPFWNHQNDPATWQHIVTYGITFGEQADAVPDWYSGNQASYEEYVFNKRIQGYNDYLWTGYDTVGDANDVKHAAYNGRGQYFSANTADGLVKAFDTIFSNIISRQAVSRAVGASVPQTSAGDESLNQLYVSEFDPETFEGKLKALKLFDGDKDNFDDCFSGDAADKPHAKGELCDPLQVNWEAAEEMSKEKESLAIELSLLEISPMTVDL